MVLIIHYFVVVGQPENEYLGVQFNAFLDELVPSEEVMLTVKLIYNNVDYSQLTKDTKFKVMEGGNKVATGRILSRLP